MKRTATNRNSQAFLWPALVFPMLVFCFHFFLGGGSTKLINDSRAYLAVAQGERAGIPFDSRILGPFIASSVNTVFGIPSIGAFHLLTCVSLIASLLLLRKITSGQRGLPVWQAAVLLTLGCASATTFGYTPVMVDLLLLVLASLTLLAVARNRWIAVLLLSILSALTKEYGILLGIACAVVAWARNHKKFAPVIGLSPILVLVAVVLIGSGSGPVAPDRWRVFAKAMFGYHQSLFNFRGAIEYFGLLYMWSWSVLWPVLGVALGVLFARFRSGEQMTNVEIAFTVMLFALPILLLGDWGRSLLIIVPFASAVATRHELTRNKQFVALLGIGGLSTALARPFHGEFLIPKALTIAMSITSIVSSVLIGFQILRFRPEIDLLRYDSSIEAPMRGVEDR